MNPSIWIAIKPIASQAARDFLRTVGTALAAHGYITGGAGTEAFVGAGMTLAGLFWGWFTTVGYVQLGGLLQKLTATRTPKAAVEVAKVMPSAELSGAAEKAKAVVSAGDVAKVLLIAFMLSAMLLPRPADAQIKLPRPAITGDLRKDLKTDGQNLGLIPPSLLVQPTGNVSQDLQALWTKIVAASNADLAYASKLAAGAGTQSSMIRKQCWDAIVALNEQANGLNLKDAAGNLLPKPDPHLFTDVETLAEVVDNLSPQGPLFTSCAGAAQLAKTNVLTFINAVVTGAAGLAAIPVIPGL